MATDCKPRRVIVLGSTGSIGTSALRVIDHLNQTSHHRFDIVGLAANSNFQLLQQQAHENRTAHLAVAQHHDDSASPNGHTVFTGPDAARQLVQNVEADLVVAAIVGSAGIDAVIQALTNGTDVALANKETLVAAGELVMPLARRTGARLLPIDSEHSAILQCLLAADAHATALDRTHETNDDIRRIVLTASGGPFRTWSKQRIQNATRADALNHPTWTMGAKITIDSATMTNKALEIIEAHWLFGLPSERIDVLVHPQSIIHGLVEFSDGAVMAQLGAPDMCTPIQLALTYPDRAASNAPPLDLQAMSRLDFEPPDEDRFPALSLARRVLKVGHTSGAIMNAANEAAVAAFLDEQITFGQIALLTRRAMDAIDPTPITAIEDIHEADTAARRFVEQAIAPQGARA